MNNKSKSETNEPEEIMARSSSRLGRQIFNLQTGVQIPYGLQKIRHRLKP
jgi:hypothetical protein